jgi:glycosyltransferase involved in cell wall biosynthesis
MLAGVAAAEADLQVRLFVSKAENGSAAVRRFGGAVCVPVLGPRRHVWRLLNFSLVLRYALYQVLRERRRGKWCVLFVRNDPAMLLAAAFARRFADRLVFQSSFPHEWYSGGSVKLALGRLLYRIAGRRVDAVTGVSPLGVKRAAQFCPRAQLGPHIPLLNDFSTPYAGMVDLSREGIGLRFIYIGAHSTGRRMGTVLAAVVMALRQGSLSRFFFVGAKETEIAELRALPDVSEWVGKGRISITGPVPRGEIPALLSRADVGMSLIPPIPVYVESSPTKLAEYLGAGLLVLATRGIPMQEEFVDRSGAGVLVDWDVTAMSRAIGQLEALSDEERKQRRLKALWFAKHELSYVKFLDSFRSLVGSEAYKRLDT